MIEMIDFQGKKWQVVGKCSGERIDDHTKLKSMYGCDLVLKNNQSTPVTGFILHAHGVIFAFSKFVADTKYRGLKESENIYHF